MSGPAPDERKKGRRREYSSPLLFQIFCYQNDNREQSLCPDDPTMQRQGHSVILSGAERGEEAP